MLRLRVKELLEERNISQGKLSRGADIPSSTVRRLIHDKDYQPNLGTLDKVAKYLGVTIDSLYYDDGE
jgi:transcriptional regulator with XRE-family HTH domain